MENQILLSNQRICSMCKTIKLVGEFYRDRQYYTSRCKKCLDKAGTKRDLEHKNALSDMYITDKLIGAMMAQARRSGWVLKQDAIRTNVFPELIDAKRNLISLDNSLKQKQK